MTTNTQQKFQIKTASYEGPLELLLDLIEKHKLFINEISLATIADDFIAFIKNHEEFPIEQSSEFIVIASTLLLIKSRSLLPNLNLTPEEEQNIDDLEKRLAHFKRIKELSRHVQKLFGSRVMFIKNESYYETRVFVPDHETNLPRLAEAIRDILSRVIKMEKLSEVTMQKIVSLEEMIDRLIGRMQKSLSASFRQFAGVGNAKKTDVIVSFLAMLELVKRGVIMAKQGEHFSDIELHSENVGTPSYA